MKKQIKMINLECANCAAKMEAGIRKIPGVEDVMVSFLLQKLTICAPPEQMEEILEKAQKICRKIEPDCRLQLG